MAATINDLFTDAMEEEITSLLSFLKVNIWDFNSFRFQAHHKKTTEYVINSP